MSHATATPVTMTARPSLAASALSVVAAAAAMVLVGISVVPVLAIELGALLVVAGGMALSRRTWSIPGLVIALVGAGGCTVAVGLAAASASGMSEILHIVPGTIGIALLGFAVVPVRGSGTRWLVKAGAGGVFLSVGLAGLFATTSLGTLLIAGTGAIVAWDAGEHAIDVGRQLGRSATTWRLDVSHVGATAIVGGLGVALGHGVAGMQSGGLSLSSFALLFLALVLLTLALHR